MEWTTLNNLCLGNQLSANFATEWSKDGRIFILSDNCVYILKLTPKMTNIDNVLSFTRSEIQICDYYVAKHTGIDYHEILLNLSKENMYHHILNVNLTPDTKLMNSPNKIPLSAAWSPIPNDEIYKTKALIGIVSNTGNLEIFIQDRYRWSVVGNITEFWVNFLKKNWKTEKQTSSENKFFEIHSERVKSALATCFGWSKICSENDKKFLYVVVGHASGHVSLWKLNYFNYYNEKIEIKSVHSFKTKLENITAIHIHFLDDNLAWIIIGNLDGFIQVKTIHFDKLNTEKTTEIWTHKDVRVSKIVSLGFDNNVGIIVLKGPYIIFSVLSKDGTINKTSYLNVGNINITGIQQISPGIFAITTATGFIQKLKILKTISGYELKLYPIISDLKWDYHACHGIIKSPNEILWGILTHPCKMTDHLTLRSPIQLTFCIAKDFDPGSYLKSNHSLTNSWECLEILRCLSAKNNTLPCTWIVKIEKYDQLSLYEIRLFFWISSVCETLTAKRSRCRKLKNTLPPMSQLKHFFYFKYRIERLKYLLDKFENTEISSEFYNNSIYLLYDAIAAFQQEEIYSYYFGKTTNEEVEKIKKKYDNIAIRSIPKCLWCEENAEFYALQLLFEAFLPKIIRRAGNYESMILYSSHHHVYSTACQAVNKVLFNTMETNLSSKPCKLEHPDQRCCISGVQISGIAEWECDRCGLPAHELNEDQELFCPLCDIPLVRNT